MNFAREGYPFMALSATVAVAMLSIAVWRRSWSLWLLGMLLLLVAVWVAWFFRDPERTGPGGERAVIATVDGKVVMVTQVDEPMYVSSRHGDAAGRGSRHGLIRFASRIHVFVPTDSTVSVTPGRRTVAGSAVIAQLPA